MLLFFLTIFFINSKDMEFTIGIGVGVHLTRRFNNVMIPLHKDLRFLIANYHMQKVKINYNDKNIESFSEYNKNDDYYKFGIDLFENVEYNGKIYAFEIKKELLNDLKNDYEKKDKEIFSIYRSSKDIVNAINTMFSTPIDCIGFYFNILKNKWLIQGLFRKKQFDYNYFIDTNKDVMIIDDKKITSTIPAKDKKSKDTTVETFKLEFKKFSDQVPYLNNFFQNNNNDIITPYKLILLPKDKEQLQKEMKKKFFQSIYLYGYEDSPYRLTFEDIHNRKKELRYLTESEVRSANLLDNQHLLGKNNLVLLDDYGDLKIKLESKKDQDTNYIYLDKNFILRDPLKEVQIGKTTIDQRDHSLSMQNVVKEQNIYFIANNENEYKNFIKKTNLLSFLFIWNKNVFDVEQDQNLTRIFNILSKNYEIEDFPVLTIKDSVFAIENQNIGNGFSPMILFITGLNTKKVITNDKVNLPQRYLSLVLSKPEYDKQSKSTDNKISSYLNNDFNIPTFTIDKDDTHIDSYLFKIWENIPKTKEIFKMLTNINILMLLRYKIFALAFNNNIYFLGLDVNSVEPIAPYLGYLLNPMFGFYISNVYIFPFSLNIGLMPTLNRKIIVASKFYNIFCYYNPTIIIPIQKIFYLMISLGIDIYHNVFHLSFNCVLNSNFFSLINKEESSVNYTEPTFFLDSNEINTLS